MFSAVSAVVGVDIKCRLRGGLNGPSRDTFGVSNTFIFLMFWVKKLLKKREKRVHTFEYCMPN